MRMEEQRRGFEGRGNGKGKKSERRGKVGAEH